MMGNAMSRTGGNVTRIAPPTYTPPTPDVAALIAAKREGLAVWSRDLTPDRLQAIRQQLCIAEAALAPVAPEVVKSWLAALAGLVANAPEPSGELLAAFFEVCSDIPDGAWTRESRVAWVRQPPRNGFPVGSRWPAPGDLHIHLDKFGQALRDEVAGLRSLLAISERPPERSGRVIPDDDARAAVRKTLHSWRSEFQEEEIG